MPFSELEVETKVRYFIDAELKGCTISRMIEKVKLDPRWLSPVWSSEPLQRGGGRRNLYHACLVFGFSAEGFTERRVLRAARSSGVMFQLFC